MLPPRDGFAIGREAEITLRQLLFSRQEICRAIRIRRAARTRGYVPHTAVTQARHHTKTDTCDCSYCYHTKQRITGDDDTSLYDSDHHSLNLPRATIGASSA